MSTRAFDRVAQMGLRAGVIMAALCWLGTSWDARATLDPADPSIINLFLLNEQTSGQINNSVVSHYDTAPTGTAQNHDTFGGTGPYWGTGADFEAGGVAVGTGTGLTFDRSNGEHTRHAAWLTTSQGNYSNGDSYTVMTRLFATEAIDNTYYHTLGSWAHYIQFQGISTADRLVMLGNVRGGTPNETHWNLTSQASGGGVTGSTFFMDTGKWYNVFLIYEQNTALTLAIDDGTTFDYLRSADVPAGFDTITNGFGDPNNSWAMGTFGLGGTDPNTFDGRMESIVYFDKALSLAEADDINLTNIPEPASLLLLALGFLLIRRRHDYAGK